MTPKERQRFESQMKARLDIAYEEFDELLDRVDERDARLLGQARELEALQQVVDAHENRLPDMEVDPTKVRRPSVELAVAERVVQEWCHAAGWATGHGDTLADILSEMRAQHCQERSFADLAKSGGLPEVAEAQARHDLISSGLCCANCGTVTLRTGSCYSCPNCGWNTGCD